VSTDVQHPTSTSRELYQPTSLVIVCIFVRSLSQLNCEFLSKGLVDVISGVHRPWWSRVLGWWWLPSGLPQRSRQPFLLHHSCTEQQTHLSSSRFSLHYTLPEVILRKRGGLWRLESLTTAVNFKNSSQSLLWQRTTSLSLWLDQLASPHPITGFQLQIRIAIARS
jgi:hypothetical protein